MHERLRVTDRTAFAVSMLLEGKRLHNVRTPAALLFAECAQTPLSE